MIKLRVILITVGIILSVLFAFPIVFASILNFGNAAGILFSFTLILLGVFGAKIAVLLRKAWTIPAGKIIICFLLLVIIFVIVFVVTATVKMVSSANNQPDEETTLVVLGCQIHPYGPSLMLEERLIAAHSYLSENENIKCILSGGQGENEVMSEAQGMYNWLVERGIDKDRLILEDKSTSTRENLLFSRQIIEEKGLSPKITIVTNDFHQYRAALIADSLGMEHYSISGKTFFLLFPTYYVRELGGILREWISVMF